MRNIIFGMIGVVMICYATLIGLCIYGIQLREHEMDDRLSQIAVASLGAYYVPEFLREEGFEDSLPQTEKMVKSQVIQELEQCSTLESDIVAKVDCLDLDKGILSLTVEESYQIPTGKTVTRSYSRTAIMERKQWTGKIATEVEEGEQEENEGEEEEAQYENLE